MRTTALILIFIALTAIANQLHGIRVEMVRSNCFTMTLDGATCMEAKK